MKSASCCSLPSAVNLSTTLGWRGIAKVGVARRKASRQIAQKILTCWRIISSLVKASVAEHYVGSFIKQPLCGRSTSNTLAAWNRAILPPRSPVYYNAIPTCCQRQTGRQAATESQKCVVRQLSTLTRTGRSCVFLQPGANARVSDESPRVLRISHVYKEL